MNHVSAVTRELTNGASSDFEKIQRLFYYVRDEVKFDFVDQFQSAEKVLNGKRGACMNKALLLKEMAVHANIPARLHFMRVSKYALEDCMPKWLFDRWPKEFYHTLVEVKLEDQWISIEPTFDQEFHEVLLEKKMNFAKYEERRTRHYYNAFTIEGVKSPQQDCLIHGSASVYGEDLCFLKKSMKELPIWKTLFMRFFFKLASNYVNRVIRSKKSKIHSPITEEGRILTSNFTYEGKYN